MELNEILNPWIQQMAEAFQPYPNFVNQVTEKLNELEKLQAEMSAALNQAHEEIRTRSEQLSAANARSSSLEQALSSASSASPVSAPVVAPVSALSVSSEAVPSAELTTKILSLQTEIASLKSQLQTQLADLQGKQLQLEAQRVQLEEQATIRRSQQNKLDEYQNQAKTQDAGSQDLRLQIETLKAALAEARAHAAEMSETPTPSERAPRSPSAPRNTQPKAPALPERRVLLVDDAEINRVLMSHYFKGLPVKLEFAVSVTAAIQKCKEHRFDLIVVDDELQGLENTELTQSSFTLVALSNKQVDAADKRPEFQHVLNRGQARESFVEQLKSFLWSA